MNIFSCIVVLCLFGCDNGDLGVTAKHPTQKLPKTGQNGASNQNIPSSPSNTSSKSAPATTIPSPNDGNPAQTPQNTASNPLVASGPSTTLTPPNSNSTSLPAQPSQKIVDEWKDTEEHIALMVLSIPNNEALYYPRQILNHNVRRLQRGWENFEPDGIYDIQKRNLNDTISNISQACNNLVAQCEKYPDINISERYISRMKALARFVQAYQLQYPLTALRTKVYISQNYSPITPVAIDSETMDQMKEVIPQMESLYQEIKRDDVRDTSLAGIFGGFADDTQSHSNMDILNALKQIIQETTTQLTDIKEYYGSAESSELSDY